MIFEWDDANRDHIVRHDVTPEEVEQVLWNDPLDLGIQYDEADGVRLTQLGETDRGRILVVISTQREEFVRPITTWDGTRQDRTLYLNWKARQQWRPK